MNKREKEVIKSQLETEKAVLNSLESQYKRSLNDIINKTKVLQADIDMLQAAGDADDATLSMVRSKVYQKQYQEALKAQIEGILDKLHSDNYSTIQGYLNGCYEEAYVGTMYSIAGQGIPIIMPIDQSAVVKAVQLDSKISTKTNTRVGALYNALGVDDLKKKISNEVSRGIATSLSWADMARNLNNAAGTGLSNATRIARTEGHRIQQTASDDARQAAKTKGADVVKQWDASLDGRTRDTHRKLDGQIREVDEPFEVDGMSAMYPGQFGDPAEDCNCRCVALTRARWALDDDELQTLKDRAEYFGLDKTKDFDDFKTNYLKAAEKIPDAEAEKQIDEEIKTHKISEGKNLVGEVNYRNRSFDFDIEMAMNEQGFDGKPQVMQYEEFAEAMKKSGFYAERTYSAESQELLQEYQKQLYDGKWYVDCSEGGAQYGRGMYCAATYDLENKANIAGIATEMAHYQEVNMEKGFTNMFTEGLTLQPDAKIFTLYNDSTDIFNRYIKEYALKNAQSEEAKSFITQLIDIQEEIGKASCSSIVGKVDWDSVDKLYDQREAIRDSLRESKYNEEVQKLFKEGNVRTIGLNEGALAAEMGYDAINAIGHGESDSYTVILNRTKVIFCEGGSIYGN